MTQRPGPILFGYCLDIFLYGILTVQIYLYYLAFPGDRRMTKAIVYFVYIVGTTQTALALHDFYTLFCTAEGQKYLDPSPSGPHLDLDTFGFMWFTIPVGGVLIASAAQLFYAHRIYVISKAKVITGIVCLLTSIQLVSDIVGAVSFFTLSARSAVGLASGRSLMVGAVAGILCDLLIAIYMSYYLLRQMRGASRPTQALVTKVVRLVIETGILTAAMAIVYMILITPGGTSFMVPGLTHGKIYANSILVLLNNRFTILGGRNAPRPDSDIASYSPSDIARDNTRPVVSRSITFARGRQTDPTFSDGTVHTIELGLQSRPAPEGSNETASKTMEAGSF